LFLLWQILLPQYQATTSTVTDAARCNDKRHIFNKTSGKTFFLEGTLCFHSAAARGTKLTHTVNETGKRHPCGSVDGTVSAGVGYQYAVTHSPQARRLGGEILHGFAHAAGSHGQAGLLARGYSKDTGRSKTGSATEDSSNGSRPGKVCGLPLARRREVDNFNAVSFRLRDLLMISRRTPDRRNSSARDVDRLMTHLLDNHCRIIDVDGE